jgi:hypothetical protein
MPMGICGGIGILSSNTCLQMIYIIKALLDAITQHPEHVVNDYMPEIDYEMLPR